MIFLKEKIGLYKLETGTRFGDRLAEGSHAIKIKTSNIFKVFLFLM